MKRKQTALFSQKKLIKSALMLISLFLMICSAWIAEPLLQPAPNISEVPKLFSNHVGDDLENLNVTAISNAKQSVLLMIFALTNERIIQAIRQKSEEGIPVKVICDAKASPNILLKLGPKIDVVRRFAKGLMHLKILVVDGEECWIGSANFTNESLNMHGNLIVALKDPSLAKTLEKKAATLKEYDREDEVAYNIFSVGKQKIELSFLPDDRKGSQRIKQLIRSAQKTIRIAMFTWTRNDLAKEVIDAKKRGVKVEVVLDNSSAKGASAKIADLLKKEKVSFKLSKGIALLHHKFLWVDDRVLEIGSANWTKAAFNQNDDCFLILHHLTEEQNRHLKLLWESIYF